MNTETEVIEQPETEDVVEQVEPEAADVGEGAPEDMGLVVEIGGEEEEEVDIGKRNMRNRIKELTAKVREYEAKAAQPVGQDVLPPEPQLEDFEYDAEAFKSAHKEWVLKSIEHEKRQAEIKAVQEKAQQRWESRLAYYDEAKSKLGVQDYDDAEATVTEILAAPFVGILAEDVRIGIIKQVAKDPAALVYALAKNPVKAKELASIEDPAAYAYALGALENGMKVIRGKAPPPEKKIGGGVPGVSGALDNTLERLREKAEQTGDYTEVARYKRQMKG